MATVRERQQGVKGAVPRQRGVRRIRVAVQRVGPWSIFKLALLFYLCLMLVVVIGLALLYMFLDAVGVLDSVADLLTGLGFGDEAGFEINGGFLFRMIFLIGLISVVLWSAFSVLVAFLYNLIADLVGGIEVTLRERQ